MVDQFRAPTKKTEDVHDIRVGKTDFKPETVTNCHGLMDDLISRAAAIDILYNFAGCIADTPGDWYKAFEKYKYDLENLPSAQPETYKEKLKEIADALSEKFAYMNTCLNERDIILGYLGVKRPSKTHCNTDCTNIKCESYCYNKRLSSAQPEIKTDGDTISR
jgi:hypothetical protein